MKNKIVLYLISILFITSSCKVFQPSRMFRLGKTYKYADSKELPRLNDTILFYKIAVGDMISFNISPNKGEYSGNIGGGSIGGGNIGGGAGGSYLVEYDGTIKLPIFGRTKIVGYTLREAEKFLENKYSEFFVEPFIQLNVTNKRLYLFREDNTSIVTLPNYNTTTLLEFLAQTGGVGDSKAYNIKLIRSNKGETKVYQIDLSTMKKFDQGNIVLLANDIIYFTPRMRATERISSSIAPYLSMLTLIVSLYSLTKLTKL